VRVQGEYSFEMHLSNAYRKLGIESRRALPEALLS
jgi:DNA-binding CsgD family transcriptional regulator